MASFVKVLFQSTLTAYSAILFHSSLYLGLFTLLITFINPDAAITGFLGVVFSNILAFFFGVYTDRIKKGLYGFNGLLVGLSISLYHNVDLKLVLILFVASILLVILTLALEYLFSYFLGLPVLSIPFVIVSIIIYLAFYNYTGFTFKQAYTFPYDANFPEIPKLILYYLKSLGGIFFQSSPWAGVLLCIVLLIASRVSFLLSIVGFYSGYLFHQILGGDMSEVYSGGVGFNYILTAISVGGIFLVPSPHSFLLAIFATLVSTLLGSFGKVFLIQFNIPVLAMPFVVSSLLFLYVARLLRNPKFIPIDFPPGTPEENLDYFRTKLSRFGRSGYYIRLPFMGQWKVTQGYNGKYTHNGLWKDSLDFMSVDLNGNLRKGLQDNLEDYYTFNLPVLAPCAGRVYKVVSHIEDNPIGSVDTKNNWGNLVLIEHGSYLYSQVSHLKKDSILVKEGEYILAGSKIGLAGNSGRSPEPHIHLHFQSTPEIGSPTIFVPITQYQNDSSKKIFFNQIPEENEIVHNLNPDFNLKTFFSFAPGMEMKINLTKTGGKTYTEKWKVNLDLLGNRFIEDENSNKLYFFYSLDYFSCLDYIGKKNTGLFFLYLTYYRVPFSTSTSSWVDKISYKYFSTIFQKLLRDLINPFSEKVGFLWEGSMEESKEGILMKTRILQNLETVVFESELNYSHVPPGEIKIKIENEIWVLQNAK